jgi:hypothetical protein
MCTYINDPMNGACLMCGAGAELATATGRDILRRRDLERTEHEAWGPRPDGEDGTLEDGDNIDARAANTDSTTIPNSSSTSTITNDSNQTLDLKPGDTRSLPPPAGSILADPAMLGQWRGIEGAVNSCASDALIFALFAGTAAFDWLLDRAPPAAASPASASDAAGAPPPTTHSTGSGDPLATLCGIVRELRSRFFVDARAVVRLRTELIAAGLMRADSEEKDVEEVLTSITALAARDALVAHGLRVLRRSEADWTGDDPLSDGFLYTIFPTSEMWARAGAAGPRWACLQDLIVDSLRGSDLWLEDVPEVLAVMLPRSGEGRTFDCIVPSGTIDLEAALVDSALDGRMSLRSIVCIESSHYVAYARFDARGGGGGETGNESAATGGEWALMDSMADRLGECANVPRVTHVPGFAKGIAGIEAAKKLERTEPLFRRCLRDAYFCVYVKGV